MYCQNCGNAISENSKFCPNCGAVLPDAAEPAAQSETQTSEAPVMTQPVNEAPAPAAQYAPQTNEAPSQRPTTNPSCYASPVQPVSADPVAQPTDKYKGCSMKWYHFQVYFAIWLGALIDISTAFQVLTGSQYGSDGESEWLYGFFPSLETADTLYGLALLGIGVLFIVMGVQMLKLKKNAPKLLVAGYAASVIALAVYLISICSILQEVREPSEAISQQNVFVFVVYIVMIVVNYIYYRKRSFLFVN